MKKLLNTALSIAAVAVTFSGAASAQILNGSFETEGAGGAGTAADWTLTGNVFVDTEGPDGYGTYQAGASNGTSWVDFNPGNGNIDGVVSQTFTTIAGDNYTISFDMGKYGPADGTSELFAEVVDAGPSAAGELGADDVATSNGVQYDQHGQEYSTYSFNFTAASDLSTISFTDETSNGGTNFDTPLDNVILTDNSPAAVPEPSTYSMMFAGLGALVLAIRRRNATV